MVPARIKRIVEGRIAAVKQEKKPERGIERTSRTGRAWSDAEVDILKNMLGFGCGYQEIARALGRTKDATEAQAWKVGVRRRTQSRQQWQQQRQQGEKRSA